jgi:hypothetical protein
MRPKFDDLVQTTGVYGEPVHDRQVRTSEGT